MPSFEITRDEFESLIDSDTASFTFKHCSYNIYFYIVSENAVVIKHTIFINSLPQTQYILSHDKENTIAREWLNQKLLEEQKQEEEVARAINEIVLQDKKKPSDEIEDIYKI